MAAAARAHAGVAQRIPLRGRSAQRLAPPYHVPQDACLHKSLQLESNPSAAGKEPTFTVLIAFACSAGFLSASLAAHAFGVAGGAAPTQSGGRDAAPFEIVIDAVRRPASPPEKFFAGFRHEGTFTASLPFCPAGSTVDLEWLGPLGSVRGTREFACGDGSGTVTASQQVIETDLTTYLKGVWRIVGGTGPYATLRGKGTFSTAMTGDDVSTRRIHETWSGVSGFDASPPTIAISQARVNKLKRPQGAYSGRIVFSARDGSEEGVVSYRMTVRSGAQLLASRSGIASPTATVTFRVRPRRAVRTLSVVIVVSDALGNESTTSRMLQLPR